MFFLIITQTDAFLVKKKHPFSRHKHGWLSKQHPVVSRSKTPSVVSEVCRRCVILSLGRNHLCVTSRLILTKKRSLIGTLISSTNDLSSETYSPTSVPLSQTHISSFASHVRLQRLYSALLCVALICRPARVIPVFLLCVVSDWLSDGVLPWYANPGCWQTICIT